MVKKRATSRELFVMGCMMTGLLTRGSAAGLKTTELDADRPLNDRDDDCEIEVRGTINVSTAPALRDKLVNLIDSGCRSLKIDVQRVEFLDGSGLGVLVGAMQRIRANGGSLELIGTSQRLIRILAMTGLDKAFDVPTSVRARVSVQSLFEIGDDTPESDRAIMS